MSPDLADAFVTHLDRARRLRRSESARRSRQPPAHREGHPRGGRARQPDPGAARSAAAAADHPAHTPPDICLERTSANKFDVKWVMGQVGHADSKMTMDVYTHLQQRLKREHGEAFEAMIREAEELMPRQRRPRDRRRRPRRDRARTPRRPAVLHRLRPSAVLRLSPQEPPERRSPARRRGLAEHRGSSLGVARVAATAKSRRATASPTADRRPDDTMRAAPRAGTADRTRKTAPAASAGARWSPAEVPLRAA
jgi:hypothetical protein